MRLADVVGALAALAVGGLVTVLLLTSVIGESPTLLTPAPPTIPPLPTSLAPSASPMQTATLAPGGSGSPASGIAVGQIAPPISVTLSDGSVMDTRDFAGQPLWIDFMATWCPECSQELPMMQQYQSHLGNELTFLVIDVGEDQHTVSAFAKSLGVDLPIGLDPDAKIQVAWGALALPVHYLIDANGVVQQVIYGGAPAAVFDEALGAILPAESASPGS